MVYSTIENTIKYKENKMLESDDKNYNAALYQIHLYDNDVIIALGQPKYTYIEKKVVYYPIYIVKENKVLSQIGIYEVEDDKVPVILDNDGDVNLELINEPILYSFVDEEFIDKRRKINTTIKSKNEEKKESDEHDSLGYSPLQEQTRKEADKEKKEFKLIKGNPWIQKYMKSNKYNIEQTKPNGNCLFESISKGYERIGIDKSIADLRKIVADNVSQEIYENFKGQYDDVNNEIEVLKKEIKGLSSKHSELKKELSITKDKSIQKNIVANAEKISERHKSAKKEYNMAKTLLEEYEFMNGINSLNAFRAIIQTNKFWAEAVTLGILEKKLNVKLILFSKEEYENNPKKIIISCGTREGDEVEFVPEHYIMLSYDGIHYELITYKDRGAMTFIEIPYYVKKYIVDRCFKGDIGSYQIIPDFKQLYLTMKEEKDNLGKGVEIVEEQISDINSDLYINDTIFHLDPKGSRKQFPGNGNNEILGSEGIKSYTKLSGITDWRRMLSNSYKQEMNIDDKKWYSVEHYYQGSKFKRNNKDYYHEFSLDSNSKMSSNANLAKMAGSISGTDENGKLIRPEHIKIDNDFYNERHKKEKELAIKNKFSENKLLKTTLLATKKAKLMEQNEEDLSVVQNELMELRKNLTNESIEI